MQGLQVFTNLQDLNLNGTKVSDLSPLAKLTNLMGLDLRGTQVSDVSPLARLANLDQLWLDGTRVSDVSPLARLTKLGRLYLDKTQVSDATLSSVAKLTNLTWLSLWGTGVLDLSVLHGLSLYMSTDLGITSFEDLRPSAGVAVNGDGSVRMPAPHGLTAHGWRPRPRRPRAACWTRSVAWSRGRCMTRRLRIRMISRSPSPLRAMAGPWSSVAMSRV